MKNIVIHHSADFDGLFCREIARKFLSDAELIGWDFGDPKIPFPAEGTVYVLDLSPECFEFMDGNSIPDYCTAGTPKRLIWIDHHKSAIEKYGSTGLHDQIPGYRIDGVAACRLAWQWFEHLAHLIKSGYHNPNHEMSHANLPKKQDYIDRKVEEPLAVRLAGEYDIWDKRDPDAEVFQFGLRSQKLSDYDWKMMLSNDIEDSLKGTGMEQTNSELICRTLLNHGRMLQSYQQRNDAGMMERSFMVNFEGLKFLALNTARCNSLTFAAKDLPETGHDALMGFYYNGNGWNFSLYHSNHRKDLDLSTIAVKYGGGGHRGACGFRVTSLKDFPILT
jgi:uncharacterized protein